MILTKSLAFLRIASGILLALHTWHSSAQDDFGRYRYKLELNNDSKLCSHMERVYNEHFAQPWNYLKYPKGPAFPRLPGIERDADVPIQFAYSRYPSAPEFEAIIWREGRYLWNLPDTQRTAPILVAEFDIDNDGRDDVVIKTSFMHTFWPAGRGAAGGQDQLFVLDKGQVDLSKPLRRDHLYGHVGKPRPARIGDDLLDMGARLIRPFVYEGVTYLAVYEQIAMFEPQKRKEKIRVLRYRGGGGNLGGGQWQPLDVLEVCRLQMTVRK